MLLNFQSKTDFHNLWEKFIKYGSTYGLRDSIQSSWKRCQELGLDPLKDIPDHKEPQCSLEKKIDQHSDIHQLLQSHYTDINSIFEILPLAIVYIDKNGDILSLCGHENIIKMSEKTNLQVGTKVTEASAGTTAPAISLMEKKGSFVLAEEHYLQSLHWSSCFSLPILDSNHEILGCLDFTTSYEFGKQLKQLTPLFYNIAKSLQFEYIIKNQLEIFEFHKAYFNSTFEYADNILILINPQGTILHLNTKAQKTLGLYPSKVIQKNICQLIEPGQYSSPQSIIDNPSHRKKITFKHPITDIFSLETIPLFNQTGDERAYILKLHKTSPSVVSRPDANHTSNYSFEDIIGQSPKIRRQITKARKIAKTPSNVLIEGETGTGKEVFAQAIHSASNYAQGPFIALNCCAFPEELIESELFGYEKGAYTGAKKDGNSGKFEQANGGTLFLDEIHTMNRSSQQKLLRVLEDRQVTRIGGKQPIHLDFRIIAASSAQLDKEVVKGNFIEPLFFRINVVRLHLPKLKERIEDIEILAHYFLQTLNSRFKTNVLSISPEVISLFSRYSWPGNVRQLKNSIESSLNYCESDKINLHDLDENFLDSSQLNDFLPDQKGEEEENNLEGITKKLMIESLKIHPTVKEAAQSLGISPSTFYRKKKRFGLSK